MLEQQQLQQQFPLDSIPPYSPSSLPTSPTSPHNLYVHLSSTKTDMHDINTRKQRKHSNLSHLFRVSELLSNLIISAQQCYRSRGYCIGRYVFSWNAHSTVVGNFNSDVDNVASSVEDEFHFLEMGSQATPQQLQQQLQLQLQAEFEAQQLLPTELEEPAPEEIPRQKDTGNNN